MHKARAFRPLHTLARHFNGPLADCRQLSPIERGKRVSSSFRWSPRLKLLESRRITRSVWSAAHPAALRGPSKKDALHKARAFRALHTLARHFNGPFADGRRLSPIEGASEFHRASVGLRALNSSRVAGLREAFGVRRIPPLCGGRLKRMPCTKRAHTAHSTRWRAISTGRSLTVVGFLQLSGAS